MTAGQRPADRGGRPVVCDQALAEEFESHRRRLLGIGYRMLGTLADAEDVVQDAYVRWQRTDRSGIEQPAGWLTRVVVNLCLNLLDSAPRRHETYPGSWLPEPAATGSGELGPLETAAARENVSMALLTIMERLSPPERAVVVLHEAFGHRHAEIADLLDITEPGSRQLLHRARARLAAEQHRPGSAADPDRHNALVARFMDAATRGDLDGLRSLLAADVVTWSDGGGKQRAALRPVVGPDKVARYWLGLSRKPEASDSGFELAELNGQQALVVTRSQQPYAAICFDVHAAGIRGIWLVVNPDKLLRLQPSAAG